MANGALGLFGDGRLSGTMLWFNAAKDLGALRTAGGERVEVSGDAFAPGEKPAGRCAGKEIEFKKVDRTVSGIVFVPEPSPRRARLRRASVSAVPMEAASSRALSAT